MERINPNINPENSDKNILKETFGSFKFKKSTERLLKEVDKELENN